MAETTAYAVVSRTEKSFAAAASSACLASVCAPFARCTRATVTCASPCASSRRSSACAVRAAASKKPAAKRARIRCSCAPRMPGARRHSASRIRNARGVSVSDSAVPASAVPASRAPAVPSTLPSRSLNRDAHRKSTSGSHSAKKSSAGGFFSTDSKNSAARRRSSSALASASSAFTACAFSAFRNANTRSFSSVAMSSRNSSCDAASETRRSRI